MRPIKKFENDKVVSILCNLTRNVVYNFNLGLNRNIIFSSNGHELMKKSLRDLQKNYPEIKIPYDKNWKYYLNLLAQEEELLPLYNDESKLQKILNNLNNFYETNKDTSLKDYSRNMFEQIVLFFKENFLEQLQSIKLNKSNLQEKQVSYEQDKVYIKVDINQANWTVFDEYIINSTLSWEQFTEKNFSLHPYYSNSKSFRQFILGNVNPKKLQALTKLYLERVIEFYKELKPFIVGVSHDEFTLCFEEEEYKKYLDLVKSLTVYFKVKYSVFKINQENNFNDFVNVKTYLDPVLGSYKKELIGVPGDRFYLHFKTLILQQKAEVEDLLFVNNNHLAKWII